MCRQLGFTSLSKDHSRALLIIPKRRYDITKNCRVLAINLQVLVSGLVRVYCISLFVSNLLAPNFEKIIAIPLQIILSLSCYLAMPSLTGSLWLIVVGLVVCSMSLSSNAMETRFNWWTVTKQVFSLGAQMTDLEYPVLLKVEWRLHEVVHQFTYVMLLQWCLSVSLVASDCRMVWSVSR